MANNNMKAYLASKYMSGPKADKILEHAGVKKKRKRPKNEDYVASTTEPGGGLVLQDEDEWTKSKRRELDLDADDAPVVGKDVATFRKGQSSWATVGASALPISETTVKEEPVDDNGAGPSQPAPTPAAPLTKRRGGLRTAAQMAAEEAARAAETRSPSPEPDKQAPTVHRDREGRVVDVEQLKAQARREEEEEQRKELERQDWTKGFKQREDRARRAKEELAAAKRDVARYADDAVLNQELKDVERWDDPAAEFVTSKKKRKGPKRPVYKGSYPQNRFGIAPGYRWDGVDRSTGFERKWLQAQNAAERRTYEGNKVSMEDM